MTRLEFLPYNFKQLLEILSARLQDLDMFDHDAVVLAARKVRPLYVTILFNPYKVSELIDCPIREFYNLQVSV